MLYEVITQLTDCSIPASVERSDGQPITMPAPSEPFIDEDVEYEEGRELALEPEAKKAKKADVAESAAETDDAAGDAPEQAAEPGEVAASNGADGEPDDGASLAGLHDRRQLVRLALADQVANLV